MQLEVWRSGVSSLLASKLCSISVEQKNPETEARVFFLDFPWQNFVSGYLGGCFLSSLFFLSFPCLPSSFPFTAPSSLSANRSPYMQLEVWRSGVSSPSASKRSISVKQKNLETEAGVFFSGFSLTKFCFGDVLISKTLRPQLQHWSVRCQAYNSNQP